MNELEMQTFRLPLRSPYSLGIKIVAALKKCGNMPIDVLAKVLEQDPAVVNDWVRSLEERNIVEYKNEILTLKPEPVSAPEP